MINLQSSFFADFSLRGRLGALEFIFNQTVLRRTKL